MASHVFVWSKEREHPSLRQTHMVVFSKGKLGKSTFGEFEFLLKWLGCVDSLYSWNTTGIELFMNMSEKTMLVCTLSVFLDWLLCLFISQVRDWYPWLWFVLHFLPKHMIWLWEWILKPSVGDTYLLGTRKYGKLNYPWARPKNMMSEAHGWYNDHNIYIVDW